MVKIIDEMLKNYNREVKLPEEERVNASQRLEL